MTPAVLPSVALLREWLSPYSQTVDPPLAGKLLVYLELLLRWNARTNLTALRDPQDVVTRHFGESLFTASLVPASAGTLLDVGSGAGFPGIPIALVRPKLRVTLAESQGKKAAFLQEAARVLEVQAEVWPRRVEDLPSALRFDVVTLRAVDRSAVALKMASGRVGAGGVLLHMTTGTDLGEGAVPVPGSRRRLVQITHR